MTPTEIREAVARLVGAGELVAVNRREIVQSMRTGDLLSRRFAGVAEEDLDRLHAAASAARPALSAIAGKVWLDVEDAKLAESALLSMGARWEFDPEGALPIAAKAAYEAADRLAREVAALAAAEAELARAEGER